MEVIVLLIISYLIVSILHARAEYVLIPLVWIVLLDSSKEVTLLTIIAGIALSLLVLGCCKMADEVKESIKRWMAKNLF
ncbi:hypothetical protein NitYY0826_C1518 [Nitratiruptor sp. YY08-26]|uniref:hypothetical protein n=1 Tax=unclassified Nitratiruptor TaxID=2624044 RepID=UPI001916AE65|nr:MULTISPECIES: hypothetical protein [unclassified Nitratiruptor]BCD62636.1 hypothetical protein NitYY0813_C1516 [Nitratiruptor sp. YY08-13]BCD66572.1 hypothetical protein NitYY0826_C1518 [Nitratiruptor sp. YY08-26]